MRAYSPNMTVTGIATRALVGGAVLCLAAGAASASDARTPATPAPVGVVAAGLQGSWGPHVIRDAMVVEGSDTILVATADTALLHAASPQRFLGTPYPVVLFNVATARPKAAMFEDSCGGSMQDASAGSRH